MIEHLKEKTNHVANNTTRNNCREYARGISGGKRNRPFTNANHTHDACRFSGFTFIPFEFTW
ncbi:Uncharacterised protein [Vibrio cholerae]|nr:Uncharacterised protein [Vibrio cholerae]CSC86077.1 Uncharacterised protein [Vibrio cholerae]